jgi:hypothetical protein
MSQLLSFLSQLDSFCDQLATAIREAQTELYVMLVLAVVAAFFAFPQKPDQI